MNKPDLFLKFKESGKNGSEHMLQKHFHLLQQKHVEPITVVDIGCGPGNITHDALMPFFKIPVCKVIGLDISEKMIDVANANYGNDVFSFKTVDLGCEVPQEFVSYFDFVFSYWTLQWLRNQRQLYSNIYKIMKPNGQMFVTYIAQSKLFDIYQSVWRKPEYSPYITNFYISQSVFQKSKDPKAELRVILEESGFEVSMIEIEKVGFANATADEVQEMLTSLNPVYDKIPSHLKEQFMLDHVKEVDRKTGVDAPDNYYMNVDIFVVCAKKK